MLNFEEYVLISSLTQMNTNIENMAINEGIASHIGKLAIITSLLSPVAQADMKNSSCDISNIQQIYNNYNTFQSKYKNVITTANDIMDKNAGSDELEKLWDDIEDFQQKGKSLTTAIDNTIKNSKCNDKELQNKLTDIKNSTIKAIDTFEVGDNLTPEQKWTALTGEEFID